MINYFGYIPNSRGEKSMKPKENSIHPDLNLIDVEQDLKIIKENPEENQELAYFWLAGYIEGLKEMKRELRITKVSLFYRKYLSKLENLFKKEIPYENLVDETLEFLSTIKEILEIIKMEIASIVQEETYEKVPTIYELLEELYVFYYMILKYYEEKTKSLNYENKGIFYAHPNSNLTLVEEQEQKVLEKVQEFNHKYIMFAIKDGE